jgi:hypothetical protein
VAGRGGVEGWREGKGGMEREEEGEGEGASERERRLRQHRHLFSVAFHGVCCHGDDGRAAVGPAPRPDRLRCLRVRVRVCA